MQTRIDQNKAIENREARLTACSTPDWRHRASSSKQPILPASPFHQLVALESAVVQEWKEAAAEEQNRRKEGVAVRCQREEEERRSFVAGAKIENEQIDSTLEQGNDDSPNILAADRSQDTIAEALLTSLARGIPAAAAAFHLRKIAVDSLPNRAQSSPCSTPRGRRREDLEPFP